MLLVSDRSPVTTGSGPSPRPRLIVTIDTEEDNWGDPKGSIYQLDNIHAIPEVQQIFDSFKVRPTYLVTYPVAVCPDSVAVLAGFLRTGRCEIGAHCHPWNTPPLSNSSEPERNGTTMLCTLSPEMQAGKIKALTEQITASFGLSPVSFRTGRWGYGPNVGLELARQGYLVDSSVSPYIDWSSKCGPDYSRTELVPHQEYLSQLFPGAENVKLLEIPASIGFLQNNFARANRLYNLISKSPLQKLHLIGMLDRMHLLNRIWLSPEMQDEKQMIDLAKILIRKNFSFLNFTFHSPSLKIGLTPFVRNEAERKRFLDRIRGFLSFIEDQDLECVTLKEAHSLVQAKKVPVA